MAWKKWWKREHTQEDTANTVQIALANTVPDLGNVAANTIETVTVTLAAPVANAILNTEPKVIEPGSRLYINDAGHTIVVKPGTEPEGYHRPNGNT